MNAYARPADFRQALLDRVRKMRLPDPENLHKRVAMERLLVRLHSDADGSWVLKGGFAMELRLRGRARTTRDLDIAAEFEVATPIAAAEAQLLDRLRQAASRSEGDYFEFDIAASTTIPNEETNAITFQVNPLIAGEIFGAFGLDVGLDSSDPGPHEMVDGSGHLQFAGVPAERFRVVSIARHFADKVHAYSRPREVRSRVKDLVDLMLLKDLGLPDSPALRAAVETVFAALDTHPLLALLPRPPLDWQEPFEAEAARTGLGPMSLDRATAEMDRIWKDLGF